MWLARTVREALLILLRPVIRRWAIVRLSDIVRIGGLTTIALARLSPTDVCTLHALALTLVLALGLGRGVVVIAVRGD